MLHYHIRDKNILITGATGFIGRHLCERLSREGARVRGLVRSTEKGRSILPAGVDLRAGDVLKAESVRSAMSGCDAVLHLANIIPRADSAAESIVDVNIDGTRIVAEMAAAVGVDRFIHVSSVSVYGHSGEGVRTEDSRPTPSDDAYSRTKFAAEQAVLDVVKRENLPAIIVRPGAIYGPYDRGWTLTPLQLIESGKMVIPFGGRGLMQPLFVSDLIDGLVRVLERGRLGEIYILTGPEVVTMRHFFTSLGRLIGKKRIRTMPGWVALAAAGLLEGVASLLRKEPLVTREQVRHTSRQTTFSHEKARAELGFEPKIGLAEGMRQVGEWLRRDRPRNEGS